MRRFVALLAIIIFFSFFRVDHTQAFTITSDPQYIVMNFSEINELDWGASDHLWQTYIKPKIVAQLRELEQALPRGTEHRKLAWSTLQEYTNTPADIPSDQSYYAIKMRRILEITEEENLPVFLPLNGFQWWDEQPDLYNWWDPDGTHTDPKFFARQRTPDFKERFIAGYNPENRWNVEWQTPTTPMKLNYRNWGGGGFRLAPPPNLLSPRFQEMQKGRLIQMISVLRDTIDRWQQEGKGELFAGITIGTELSLNASVLPKDEFEPYGYRSMQDMFCPQNEPTCAATHPWNKQQLEQYRQAVINNYLTNMSRLVTQMGIPKERIYTHVWSESEPGDPRYTNYAAATFNLYSRPGMSFYGHAENPIDFNLWSDALKKNGQPLWGAVEYTAGTSQVAWRKGLLNTFDSIMPAKVLVIYNWTQHKNTGAIAALKEILGRTPPSPECSAKIPIPLTPNGTVGRTVKWSYLQSYEATEPGGPVLHVLPGLIASKIPTDLQASDQKPARLDGETEIDAPPGVYTWFITSTACRINRKIAVSEPRVIVIPVIVEDTTPAWVRAVLRIVP